jgi:hypothetical protein
MHDLMHKHIFGRLAEISMVIEYQKRSLPHAHVMVIIHPYYRQNTAEDVRTVLDVQYDTYRETCVALIFLDDDNEWDLVMTDSAAYYMMSHMRATFVILMVFNEVEHPAGLFEKHWREMDEDFVHMLISEEHPLSDNI